MVGALKYDAFLSYEHEHGQGIAKSIQIGLQSFSKPWVKGRALRVFRDKSNLSATPELWNSIENSIKHSEYFILLASPESAKSKWVLKELKAFLKFNSSNNILIVLVAGNIKWDHGSSDFDWKETDAIPRLDNKIFSNEPLYVDVRFAKSITNLNISNEYFLDSIATLSSTIRDIPKDELIGDHISNEEQAISTKRVNIAMRCIAGFGFGTILPWLGLVLEMKEQVVMLLGLPAIGMIGGFSSGLKIRGIMGFAIGYFILVLFYYYGCQMPFDNTESIVLFFVSIIGFSLSGTIGAYISEKKLWKTGLYSFLIGGVFLSMSWIIFTGLRPEERGESLMNISTLINYPSTFFEDFFDMGGFWWRDPLIYLPLFIANIIAGGIFGWFASKITLAGQKY